MGWWVGLLGMVRRKEVSFHLRGIVNNGICVRTRMNLLNIDKECFLAKPKSQSICVIVSMDEIRL